MIQRSFVSELVLVAVVLVFLAGCILVINAVHRGLPDPETLAASLTPQPSPVVSPVSSLSTLLTTSTVDTATAQTLASTPTPSALATPTPSLDAYAPVTGNELDANPEIYQGKKVVVTGDVYYVDPRGENTWVQILTADTKYIDINLTGHPTVNAKEHVKIFGVADGKTTIKAADGNAYVQPYINPGDVLVQG